MDSQLHHGCTSLYLGRPRALHLQHGSQCQRRQTRRTARSSTRQCSAKATEAVQASTSSLTLTAFEQAARWSSEQAGGAGGGTTYEALQAADAAWARLRNQPTGAAAGLAPRFVQSSREPLGTAPTYDVAVCGGTLGIFLAAALAHAGWRCVLVERGPLRGRTQEWNISRKELDELVAMGVLSAAEAEECISVEFNPVRCAFHGGREVWTRDVLNLGVSPARLVDKARRRFEAAGGQVLESTSLEGVTVHPDGVGLQVPQAQLASSSADVLPQPVTARLLIDCMGNFSPIVRQQRWGVKPDGVCLVVGSCARGFPADANTTGDVIMTTTPLQAPTARVSHTQYFWEAFPAGSGPTDRTTYMFTYLDAEPGRPSLEAMMEDYLQLMPAYQGVELDQLSIQRILFGFFPTYRASPLRFSHDRLLAVGDASGIQSPLSFGGFGALTRHLPRLLSAVSDALEVDALDQRSLARINAYNPGLSGAWMLQRAMSVRLGDSRVAPDFINRLLSSNFAVMQRLGDPVMKPFLQDVVQFRAFAATLAGQVVQDPGLIPQILAHVGPGPLADWVRHFMALGMFTLVHPLAGLAAPLGERLPPRARFAWRRAADSWRFGSGADYHL